MQPPNIAAGRIVGVDNGWTAGMNTVRHPWLLRSDQYRRGVNIVNRGGVAQTRPGFSMKLILPPGNLQGMTHFRVTKDNINKDYLICAVNGNIYAVPFPLQQPRSWEALRLKNLSFDAKAPMVYFCVAEKSVTILEDETVQLTPTYNVLMIQDGGVTKAAFWDGEEQRHLDESAPALETPKGSWMAFSGGRLWIARDKIVIASDIFDPLKFTERLTGEGRGDFSMPKEITGLTSFIGDGRIEVVAVFTDERSEILQSGIRDRAAWPITPNFQSIGGTAGCVSGRSICFQSGLMWWYSPGGLIASDAAASSNLTSQINYKDAEMAFSKQFMYEDQSGICALSFENYLLMACPIGQNLNSETFVLDYATLSEAASDKIPAWSGVWTGIRPVQFVSANIDSRRRAFAASVDYTTVSDGSHNHVWEIFMPEREDRFFELDSDFTTIEYRRPIYCEFESRLIGDGHDLKQFSYADINLIEIADDVTVRVDYRGMRGSYKNILCKKIIAPISFEAAGVDVDESQKAEYGILRKQSRRLSTETGDPSVGCPTCESDYSENIDKAFSMLIRWCGQLAVESIRVFMEPHPERSSGLCEKDEEKVCLVDETGQNHSLDRVDGFILVEDLYQAKDSSVWLSTRSYVETLNCGAQSVTGPISVTAVATYKSKISQLDADTQALNAATSAAQNQAAYLRSIYPCYWDSTQFVNRVCNSTMNSVVRSVTKTNTDIIVIGGSFWQDNATLQGKIAGRTINGFRITDWVNQNGFTNVPSTEPSALQINKLATQFDGKVIAIGEFAQYTNQSRVRIARLLADGELDPSATYGTGFTGGQPLDLAFQLNNKAIVVGLFTAFDGSATSVPVVRLNVDGTRDGTLSAITGFTRIYAVVTRNDDKFYLAGYDSVSGEFRVRRYLDTGAIDATFVGYAEAIADPGYASLLNQPSNNRVVVSAPGLNAGKNLIRLGNAGGVDGTFAIGSGLNFAARGIETDTSGDLYLVGNFTTYKGSPASRILKISSLGEADIFFASGTGFNAEVFGIYANNVRGELYCVGNFTSYNGNSTSRFARLVQNGVFLSSSESILTGGTARVTTNQIDADAQALAVANAEAILQLPCT